MTISAVIGLLAALIGSTATLLAAWAYIRSQHPPKGELLRTVLIIVIIMVSILGLSLLISRATRISINGLEGSPVPGGSTAIPGSTSIPGSTPGLTPTPTPTSGVTPTPTSGVTPTPTSGATPTSAPTATPHPKR